jgi:PKD repeat protein
VNPCTPSGLLGSMCEREASRMGCGGLATGVDPFRGRRGRRPPLPFRRAARVGMLGIVLLVVLGSLPALRGVWSPAATGNSASGVVVPFGNSSHYFPTPIQHVVVIMMENANASWVLQNASYERYLAHRYAYASEFYSVRHSSPPSYFAVTSGEDVGNLLTHNLTNVADLVEQAGLTWGDFQQSMPYPCDNDTNKLQDFPYAPGHDPFAFYQDVVSNATYCDSHVVSFAPLYSDLQNGTLPNYSFVVADEYNDSHNECPPFYSWETTVWCGNRWLQGFLSPVLNSSASWVNRTAFFILYDEANQTDTRGIDNTTGGGVVYMTVAGPCARAGYVSTQAYTDYNVLTTTEWLLNLGSLDRNDSWTEYPPMTSMFNFTACSPPGSLETTASVQYSPVDVGVSDAFAAQVTGGVPPYTYRWNFGDGTWSRRADPAHTYAAPSPVGGSTVLLWVNDSISESVLVVIPLVVNPPLLVSASEAPSPVDVGYPASFEANATGGTAPVDYTWSFGDGSPPVTGATATHEYLQKGAFEATVWANDSGGMSVNRTILVNVTDSPLSEIVANRTVIDVNESINFTAMIFGGLAPYTYAWRFGDGSGGAGPMIDHTYTTSGTYDVRLWVNDSDGETAPSNLTIVVHGALMATLAPAMPFPADVGYPVTLWGNVTSGGTPPETWNWTLGDGTRASGPSVTHAYDAPGNYPVNLWINDSTGSGVHLVGIVEVAPDPILNVLGHPDPTDVGVPVLWNATVAGGVGPYVIQWRFGDGSQGSGASVRHAYTAPGTYTVTAWANDSRGASARATWPEVVAPLLQVTAQASTVVADVNQTIRFTASVSGGVGPDTLTWSFGNGQTGQGMSLGEAFVTAGSYLVTVWANDSLGISAQARIAVTIHPPLVVTLTATEHQVTVDSDVTFQANVTGGTAPYSYLYRGLPGICGPTTESEVTCNATLPGEYNVTLVVRDAVGATATAALTVAVGMRAPPPATSSPIPSPPGSGFLGLSFTEEVELFGGIIGAELVAIAVILSQADRRYRRQPR